MCPILTESLILWIQNKNLYPQPLQTFSYIFSGVSLVCGSFCPVSPSAPRGPRIHFNTEEYFLWSSIAVSTCIFSVWECIHTMFCCVRRLISCCRPACIRASCGSSKLSDIICCCWSSSAFNRWSSALKPSTSFSWDCPWVCNCDARILQRRDVFKYNSKDRY